MTTHSTNRSEGRKYKRRGFVMTGGGAKGLYEAGVIHAFHLAGMEFDVITGSSIGAFNAIFFAEYLLRKKKLSAQVRAEPEAAVEAMDSMVKAYHNAWLQLPNKKIIDDSASGPLGQLKDDLLKFNFSLPDLTHLLWWWTDPDRSVIPSPGVWPAIAKLGKEAIERLGGVSQFLNILKDYKNAPRQAIITYLSRFRMDKALVPSDDDQKLSSILTNPIEPLQVETLQKTGKRFARPDLEKVALVEPSRSLKDYADAGIDVRLTRANYRTGRLEVSAYFSVKDFVRFLLKQAFRVEKSDPEKIPLGSFRIQLPGNPDAIGAALASGRFPGVLAPYPIENIYPVEDPENSLLHKMLADWLVNSDVENKMMDAYLAEASDKDKAAESWQKTFMRWRESQSMRDFFPQRHDVYVDGGAIDNTPANSAIDATREWIELAGKSKRNFELELYVVFLNEEPRVEQAKVETPILHEVVLRTLEIQEAAKQSSAAVVVDTINTFGQRAERLGDALSVLLKSCQQCLNSLDEDQRKSILDSLRKQAGKADLRGFLGESGEGILERMDTWADELINQKLPLHINKVVIYPDEMPMSTLQFTERLGYRRENAIKMLAMGCYHTLWAIFTHLSENQKDLDSQDQRVLAMARRWMGLGNLPKEETQSNELRQSWKCQRTACSFYDGICPHGKRTA